MIFITEVSIFDLLKHAPLDFTGCEKMFKFIDQYVIDDYYCNVDDYSHGYDSL